MSIRRSHTLADGTVLDFLNPGTPALPLVIEITPPKAKGFSRLRLTVEDARQVGLYLAAFLATSTAITVPQRRPSNSGIVGSALPARDRRSRNAPIEMPAPTPSNLTAKQIAELRADVKAGKATHDCGEWLVDVTTFDSPKKVSICQLCDGEVREPRD